MTKLLRQIPWLAMQIAVVGFFVWVDYAEAREGRSPNPGLAAAVGLVFAWAFTMVPVAIIEGVKDVPRLYLPALRRWRSGSRVVAARRDGGEARRERQGAGPAPLLRKLPE